MNWPNRITLSRLVLCIALIISFELPLRYGVPLSLIFFSIASLTDWLDGDLARRWNLVTIFGKLMDPLTDKIMISVAYIGLRSYGFLEDWFVSLVVTREFLVTGLRLIAATQNVVLPAERLGKYKTVLQIITALAGLLAMNINWYGYWHFHSLDEYLSNGNYREVWTFFRDLSLPFLMYLTALITVISGCTYLWKNRNLFAEEKSRA